MNIHNDEKLAVFLEAVQDDVLRRAELAEKKQADKCVSRAGHCDAAWTRCHRQAVYPAFACLHVNASPLFVER